MKKFVGNVAVVGLMSLVCVPEQSAHANFFDVLNAIFNPVGAAVSAAANAASNQQQQQQAQSQQTGDPWSAPFWQGYYGNPYGNVGPNSSIYPMGWPNINYNSVYPGSPVTVYSNGAQSTGGVMQTGNGVIPSVTVQSGADQSMAQAGQVTTSSANPYQWTISNPTNVPTVYDAARPTWNYATQAAPQRPDFSSVITQNYFRPSFATIGTVNRGIAVTATAGGSDNRLVNNARDVVRDVTPVRVSSNQQISTVGTVSRGDAMTNSGLSPAQAALVGAVSAR